ncbi:MAG TPA: class I SAM-dependent methyltransferase [Acidimicrobiia bacterium]|nr:class I SAM-dependent methyltransferase [Acidimicrobiia bacterium]
MKPEPVPADVPYYRLTVGHKTRYDVMGATQFAALVALGLRETHYLCDVGCGSLRAGRFLIPYLEAGHYCGIEPREDVLQAGIAHEIGHDLVGLREPRFDHGTDFGLARFGTPFDFVLAQSVFSHTYRDLARVGLGGIADALAPGGLFVGTVYERFPVFLPAGTAAAPDSSSGWEYPGAVAYSWREWRSMLAEAGMVAKRLRWFHVRQSWFVAARRGDEKAIDEALRGVTGRLRGPGAIGHAKRRALARLRPQNGA